MKPAFTNYYQVCFGATIAAAMLVATPDSDRVAAQEPKILFKIPDAGKVRHISAALSPDRKLLATGTMEKELRIWDVTSGRKTSTLTGHSGEVRAVAFSPNGKLLVSASGEVKVWDVASGMEASIRLKHIEPIFSFAFSPDSKLLAAGYFDEKVRIFELESGKVLFTLSGHGNTVGAVAFSPDGKTLATAGGNQFGRNEPNKLRLWEVASGTMVRAVPGLKKDGAVKAIAFSPDGKVVAVGGTNNQLVLWDAGTGKEIRVLEAKDKIFSLAFAPGGKTLAAAGDGGLAGIWDVGTGKARGALKADPFGDSDRLFSIAFISDGKALVAGGDHGAVRWSVTAK